MGVVTHGMSGTKEFWVWHSMIARCTRTSAHDYPRYGGAGVTVCDRWRFGEGAEGGLELFLRDMGRRPSEDHSLDRIDNSKGYEPGNVRWATRSEQQNNKSNNRIVSYRGEQMTAAQATAAAGGIVSRENAINRLRRGWPVEAAVETPPKWRRGGRAGKRSSE